MPSSRWIDPGVGEGHVAQAHQAQPALLGEHPLVEGQGPAGVPRVKVVGVAGEALGGAQVVAVLGIRPAGGVQAEVDGGDLVGVAFQ